MTLRDAFTAIALGHRPTTHRVRSKLRPDVYYNEPACRDCEWTGTGLLMEAHAAHVADLQVAYLRDHLAQHAEELGLKRETSHATRQCSYPGSGGPCEGHAHTRFVTEWEPIR